MPWMRSVSLALLALAAVRVEPVVRAQVESPARTVYVTVTDKAGAAVPDLGPADFIVKIGGKPRQVVHVEPATAPLKIALIVDDNGTGIFRYGVGKFIEKLQGHAEFAISKVNGQTQKLVGYTTDVRELSEAIALLNARPETADGGQLLEGIAETAGDFKNARVRRAVIFRPHGWGGRSSSPSRSAAKSTAPCRPITSPTSCGRAAPCCTSSLSRARRCER